MKRHELLSKRAGEARTAAYHAGRTTCFELSQGSIEVGAWGILLIRLHDDHSSAAISISDAQRLAQWLLALDEEVEE